jgi:zinc protease
MKPQRFLFFSLLMFAGFCFPLRAEPQLSLPLPPTTRVVLSNGLRVLVRERPQTDNVAIHIMIGAGQLTENQDQMGITNLLQQYLLSVPVEGYHDAQTALESRGGVISADSGPDNAYFSVVVSPSDFPFAMKILSDLFHQMQIDAPRFHDAQKNALLEIKNEETESFQALYGIFLQEFYTFHPYRVPVPGTKQTIESLKPFDLLSYYEAYYRPNNMVIAIAGDVETEDALKIVKENFADLKSKSIASQSIYYQPILDDIKTINLMTSGNIAWLFVGFSAPELRSPNYEAMEILNSILGSSIGSRLWISLREKRGLSYELGSQYSARQGPSHFIIYVATDPKELSESRDHLLEQVNDLRNHPLSQEELDVAKRRLIGHFILKLETNEAQAKYMAWEEISGKGIGFEQTYISLIRAVTAKQLQEVARKYFENYILISVQ